MNPNNRWIKMADFIPWAQCEYKYAKLFKIKKRKCCETIASGSWIIDNTDKISIFRS